MSALRLRSSDATRAFVVRVWHRSNAFMSDGDSPWLDEEGSPTAERSRDHVVAAGESLELGLGDELAFTVLTTESRVFTGAANAVRDFFRTGSPTGGGDALAPLLLGNASAATVQVRVYSSATFQFSALLEIMLTPGETASLTNGGGEFSVRVRRTAPTGTASPVS
ncbi:MAG: hypothetical protein U1E63_07620 [Burkholderiales bacterium]